MLKPIFKPESRLADSKRPAVNTTWKPSDHNLFKPAQEKRIKPTFKKNNKSTQEQNKIVCTSLVNRSDNSCSSIPTRICNGPIAQLNFGITVELKQAKSPG